MDNVFERIEDSSESETENSSSSSSDDEKINDFSEPFPNHFLNMKSKEEYEKNRNDLFTKDIEVFRILVDSKNINHGDNHDTSDFIFDLHSTNNSSLNKTGGFKRFKNVIGFRLIEAIIPSTPYNVNVSNNKIYITFLGSNYIITLTVGNYDNDTFSTELETKLNAGSGWVKVSDGSTPLSHTTGFTVTFNNNNDLKYNIVSTAGDFKFNFQSGDVASSHHLLGVLQNNNDSESANFTSHYIPDMSVHFLDVVVPEIPYIACKMNQKGRSVLSRIPITDGPGSIIYYSIPDTDKDYEKFFYPISLDKITVELFDHSDENKYVTNNLNVNFEFEITVLNNLNLLQ